MDGHRCRLRPARLIRAARAGASVPDWLAERFEEAFWCDELGTYALALDNPPLLVVSNRDITQIPAEWITAAKQNVIWAYGSTSQSSTSTSMNMAG